MLDNAPGAGRGGRLFVHGFNFSRLRRIHPAHEVGEPVDERSRVHVVEVEFRGVDNLLTVPFGQVQDNASVLMVKAKDQVKPFGSVFAR